MPKIILGLEQNQAKQPIGFVQRQPKPADTPLITHEEGHLLTVASTGAGKGVSCIIPALLTYTGQTIVIDPKGENYAVTADQRRKMGHKVICIDPFNITQQETRDSLSPYCLFTGDSDQDLDTAIELTELLYNDMNTGEDDSFWNNSAKSLITALIMYSYQESPPALQNLQEVQHLTSQPENDFAYTMKQISNANNPDIRSMASVYKSAVIKTSLCILATARASLEFLRGKSVGEATCHTSFNTDEFIAGAPISIYLVIPPEKLDSHSPLLRLWIGTLLGLLLRRRHPIHQPTLFLLDEAAQLGKLSLFTKAITLLRGYSVRIWSFWQDLSQLQDLYKKDWQTIYNNCSTHQFFGIRTGLAARTIADVTGFISPESLMELGSKEMWTSASCNKPRVIRRFNYLECPELSALASPNPYYHQPEPGEPQPEPEPYRDYPSIGSVGTAPETTRAEPDCEISSQISDS